MDLILEVIEVSHLFLLQKNYNFVGFCYLP